MEILREAIFWLFLISTVFTDIKYGRIFNAATFPVAIIGVVLNTARSGAAGLWMSLGGMALGLALLGWVYYLGGAGGGDVKFLGAVGALMGYEFVFTGAVCGFIVAGLAAVIFIIIKKQFARTWGNVFEIFKNFFIAQGAARIKTNPALPAMPYGVYLSIGFGLVRLYYILLPVAK